MRCHSSISVATLLVLGLVGITPAPAAASPSPQAAPAPQAPPATTGRTATSVRVTGVVRDEINAITMPGVAVEVVGTKQVVYTDTDGKYLVDLAPGVHQLKVSMDGYQPKTISVTAGTERNITVNIPMQMNRFSESVTVTETVVEAQTSTAAAQLIERKQAQVISDNMGGQEMKANGDSDAAAAMTRVTGLSIVDSQYVFVRGLGERYSNTTLGGSIIPTTEPDKKVVPLDLFPSSLLDSVQVAKSYTPDKSSEFAGGLVQINPLKLPTRQMLDVSYGVSFFSIATGKQVPMSPLGSRDWSGFDGGSRSLPGGVTDQKIVRSGQFTPDVGFSPDEITAFGKLMAGGPWQPVAKKASPGQNWALSYGNRFGKLGVVTSVSQSYKEMAVSEQRKFYHVAGGGDGEAVELEALSDYAMQYGTQKAQLGVVANFAYQLSSSHRISVDNFFTHTGKDEGRTFEGFNLDNNRQYRNYRLQFTEEQLMSNGVTGDHFFRSLSNSRLDWRVTSARATRDEPRLREALYEFIPPAAGAPTPPFTLSDESQSGFQMYNNLADDTLDASANWSSFKTGSRPMQTKVGVSYVKRERDFQSRRFRFIPIVLTKDGAPQFTGTLTPEELYTPANVGTSFRFNEETRSTDAYGGSQNTASAYGMVDVSLSASARLVAGARVERFHQEVNTFDPFELLVASEVTAENNNTDIFPAVNFVKSMSPSTNLRMSYSSTVNRPEFRELAEFEFTDVVGNRAVRGNPELQRALIQNVDVRWERFTGSRGVFAASGFYKYFDKPIETVVLGAAQPIATFQNADNARNVGIELEGSHQLTKFLFLNGNYTFVNSEIKLRPEQLTVQTSNQRALVGQSKNIFNMSVEGVTRGFSARVLYNFLGDRISEAGANEAPDVIEEGRGSVDVALSQRIGRFIVRLNLENLTDPAYRYTQGGLDARTFKLGRTVALSFGMSLY